MNYPSKAYIAGIFPGMRKIIPLLAGLILLSFVAAAGSGLERIEIRVAGTGFEVELATTPEQRRRGLMHRRYLTRGRGMLLVYPEAGDHRVWMKNMHFPLRVYWLDAEAKVVGAQRLEPCRQAPCPVYAAPKPSRYVLELGDYEHNLKPGDRVDGLRGL